ncbi:VOC family protein [Pseudoneobacillus sp. C159]
MKIKQLVLDTAHLNDLVDFYTNKLGFPIISKDETHFTIEIGETLLTFKQEIGHDLPFYHFAINIPENRLMEALEWIDTKTEISTEQGDKVIHFVSWDAHSIYFNDPAGNIVEIIARHKLPSIDKEGPFSIEEFLRVDEIGLPVQNVMKSIETLKTELGLPEWRPASSEFATIGALEGLFIVVKEKRQWFMSDKSAELYPIEMTIEGDRNASISLECYQIKSEAKIIS